MPCSRMACSAQSAAWWFIAGVNGGISASDRVVGGVLQDPGRLPVRIVIDAAAGRVGRVRVDLRQLPGAGVDERTVAEGGHHDDRPLRLQGIQGGERGVGIGRDHRLAEPGLHISQPLGSWSRVASRHFWMAACICGTVRRS